jgi:ribose 5-phosphate isomerase B
MDAIEMTDLPVALGSDDAGYGLKGARQQHLEACGVAVQHYGCFTREPVDYPDVALVCGPRVARGEHDRAILVCGTASVWRSLPTKCRACMQQRRASHIRAATAPTSNDAQVLALGARYPDPVCR